MAVERAKDFFKRGSVSPHHKLLNRLDFMAIMCIKIRSVFRESAEIRSTAAMTRPFMLLSFSVRTLSPTKKGRLHFGLFEGNGIFFLANEQFPRIILQGEKLINVVITSNTSN